MEPSASALVQSPQLESICALDMLMDRCMGDASIAASLLTRFGQRLLGEVVEIERCVACADWSEAVKRVHTLKGEAGSLAANRLHQAAAELEHCLRIEGFADALRFTTALRAEAEQCSQVVPRVLDTLTRLAEEQG